MKRVRTKVVDGFVWEDGEAGHVVACGDATDVDFVASVVGGFADLAIVDPPYNLSKETRIELKGRKSLYLDEDWDKYDDDVYARLLADIVAVATGLVRTGNWWFWTSDWWLSDVKRWMRRLGADRSWPSYHWCKPNPMPSVRKANPASAVEYVAMASRKGNHFELSEMPRQRNYHVAHPDGSFAPAVTPWWVERAVVSQAERLKKRGTKEDVNSTQKPLDLVEALVRAGCPKGGLVLDTCGGTGTTLLAADRTGRRCVYVDKDPDQVRAAASRLLRDRRERG